MVRFTFTRNKTFGDSRGDCGQLLAEVIECDEENGRNPIMGREIFLELRCVTLPIALIKRAKEVLNDGTKTKETDE